METEIMSKIFDPGEILEQIGGDKELLVDIIHIFIKTYPEDLKSLQEAIEEGDPENVRKNAHRMKGSVSNFGKYKAFETAKSIEERAKEGDLSKVKNMYEDLVIHLNLLEQEVKKFKETAA
jgi:HPt (histidine-containing phosphotransfer) domain-containing protein